VTLTKTKTATYITQIKLQLTIINLKKSQKQWPEDLMIKKMSFGNLFHYCEAECRKSFLVEVK